jgi:ribonucleoside-diphosphate reductase alpha chain
MLDNVLQYFIDNAPDTISRARYSAMRERSIGIGALGFHAYLQRHSIPFEGVMAKVHNIKMFKHIRAQLDEANKQLGLERGEAPDVESNITIEDDNGNTRVIKSSSLITIKRNDKEIIIRACALIEGDEILDV